MTEQASSAPAVSNPWLVAIAVMLATFMEVLDTSIAAVALPYIAGSLSATNDEATWVLTSYLVANAIVLPASTWFSLRFGRKRFLIACIVIFTVSSFFCGAATILGCHSDCASGAGRRRRRAAAALAIHPAGKLSRPQKRGMAMAVFALGVVVAPVLGPTLGGWLTDTYSWRWAFYINIPVGILAVFMISRFVEDPPYIKNAKARQIRRHRPRPAGRLAGLPADHPRQGPGRRLVRRDLDSLGCADPGRRLRAVSDSRVPAQANRWWICASFTTAISPSAAC